MDKEERRAAYRAKNERRKKRSQTLYADEAKEQRRQTGGAFGKSDVATFNRLSEGTSAMRRAETNSGLI